MLVPTVTIFRWEGKNKTFFFFLKINNMMKKVAFIYLKRYGVQHLGDQQNRETKNPSFVPFLFLVFFMYITF